MSIKKLNLSRIITSSNSIYNFSSSYSNKALTASYALSVSAGSGTSGTSGNAGSSGTSGANGTSGTSGNNGSSGSSGSSGATGSSGSSGATGSSGSSGGSGSSGSSGATGASGTSGTSGNSGTSGSSGSSGSAGSSGTSGATGTSGTSGGTGTSGSSGTSGTGSPGTSGTAGSSGVSATSTLQTGSLAKQTILYNVTSGSQNIITGLNLSGNKWGIDIKEEWDAVVLPGDQYYNSCSLLMHFNGSNGSTTFIDNSPTPKTATPSGNAQISTAQSKFGGASLLLDGTGDYLTLASNAAFGTGTGNFTIEFWMYPVSVASGIAFDNRASGQLQSVLGYFSAAGSFTFTGGIITTGITKTGITANNWYHVACVRSGGTVYLFVDGVSAGTDTVAGSANASNQLIIGSKYDGTTGFNGYIDDFRYTKGVARYTSNFTPPSTQFPDNTTQTQYATKYVGLIGGLNDRSVDYGIQKLSNSSLKVVKMSQTTSPFPSGSLSASVDRVYVNVLDYTKVSVTSSYARNALTASYILGGGANGSSGTSGATGASGTSGSSGSSGATGASGTSGSSGSSGATGASGTSGTSGVTGTSGSAGSSGTSGSSGATGTSGSSGATGTSGSSGATGTSGSSGATGTSGSSGASVSVSGTTNRLVKFTSASTIGNTSTVHESGSAFLGVGVSSSLVSRLQVYRSGSNASVLKVDGGSGTLFEVTDNLSGSLFSVNTIAGFPILEVFSNNRLVAGAFGTNALVVSGSSVGIGTSVPRGKLHVQGNITGSQFTSSRRNAIGFSGTASYARRALTASYALNASGGGGSTLRTGSTYPITSSKTSAIAGGTTNRFVKYTNASAVGQTFTPIFESGSAFVGVGPISTSLVSRLQVYRSGSNASVLKVDGGSGTLFEVTDNLSGSLFSVNTIAGFPILEVFSNNRIVAGAFGTNALVVSGSSVGIGTSVPRAKLHIQGNISGSQFTSSRRNAVGFSGTASYARRGLTASYALNAASGGTTLRTGSTYPITSSFSRRAITASFALAGGTRLNTGSRYPITASRAITASYALASAGGGGSGTVSSGTVNRLAKYTGATTVGSSAIVYESGSAFIGIGVTSSLLASLQVYRSGSNASVLKVDGGSGTLFEVTDNLSGSLFNVNDITGLPILEVFSNNRVVAGAFGTNALVVSGSSVGIGTNVPRGKLHIQGNITGSQFTSSRRNAVGFFGTSSYSRRALTASFALNASAGGSTLRTGSTYPFTSSKTSAIASGVTNRFVKYTNASAVGSSGIMYESGSAFVGIGVTSSLLASLQVYRSGSNASVLKVDGGSGTLFEVTDNLSGSLFNVNDITGLPILEVFSNNRIVAGTFGTNALVVSGSSVGIGTNRPLSKLDIRGGTELLNTSGSTGGATSGSLMIVGQNTKGGANYHDFLYVKNSKSTLNQNKFFRQNDTGNIEIINSNYGTNIFTLTDSGSLQVPVAASRNVTQLRNTGGGLKIGNYGSIFDDGNFHIHSTSPGTNLWLNVSGSGMFVVNGQTGASGGMCIGTSTQKGFVTIVGSVSAAITQPYGYLISTGAGSTTGTSPNPYSLTCDNRVMSSEFNVPSDERLKEIKGEISLDKAIDLVTKITPIEFTWKDGVDSGLKAGFSAQQTYKAGFEHLLGVVNRPGLEGKTDDDGFTSPQDAQFVMNYEQVTPYHSKVIKHLLEKIEKLEARIDELEKK